MKISVLCSSPEHPIVGKIKAWCEEQPHDVELLHSKSELSNGDILFLVSCSELIAESERHNYQHTLVLHASDLPKGRGWSPYIWELLKGAETITVSLLEAAEPVDSGRVWAKESFHVGKDWLWDEINEALFEAELALMSYAIENREHIKPKVQDDSEGSSYYPKRTPKDSELDVDKSLREQFDLIRVCDPRRYPAKFKLYGHTYKVTVEKTDD
ncbi:formyltransferase family protein [Idiomarina sp. HB]|uniref:formyltransferase family protein n=1 Tax=Idiomarina sp. HB TaxID=3110479 RepID=UPI003A81111A